MVKAIVSSEENKYNPSWPKIKQWFLRCDTTDQIQKKKRKKESTLY